MTLRKVIMISVLAYFCYLLFVAVTGLNNDIVSTLVGGIVILLMLPMARFKKEGVMELIRNFRGTKDDK